jgi:hypothetical protein
LTPTTTARPEARSAMAGATSAPASPSAPTTPNSRPISAADAPRSRASTTVSTNSAWKIRLLPATSSVQHRRNRCRQRWHRPTFASAQSVEAVSPVRASCTAARLVASHRRLLSEAEEDEARALDEPGDRELRDGQRAGPAGDRPAQGRDLPDGVAEDHQPPPVVAVDDRAGRDLQEEVRRGCYAAQSRSRHRHVTRGQLRAGVARGAPSSRRTRASEASRWAA